MAMTITDFLDERITAFQLNDRMFAINTKDRTAMEVRWLIWHYYDDCKDHKVILSRKRWNHIYRLLLLLKSDAQLNIARRRTWSGRQIHAGTALAIWILLINHWGWGMHLFVAAIPFGGLSILLSKWKNNSPSQESIDWMNHLAPFSSISQLLSIRRSVLDFHKQPYRAQFTQRAIRSPLMDTWITIQTYALWVLFSPVILLFQTFPSTENKMAVVARSHEDGRRRSASHRDDG